MAFKPTPTVVVATIVLAGFALLPVYAAVAGDSFVLSLGTRILVMALAAASLNLILGYGGMVSFGHAAYLGVGGYVVGIMAYHGVTSAWVQWPVAILLSAAVALFIGALSLRTRGLYFIMITLAFAQMIYYVGVGLYDYGGDDGLTLNARSDFGGFPSLDDRPQFYYLCLVLLVAALYLMKRLVGSRFGQVIRGAKSNDPRMHAIGFPTMRYRLTAFVIAGAVCGLAGVLLANQADFVSPATMHWTRSGDLIVMVVLGGMGSLMGPVYGALTVLALEESLSSLTHYWKIIFGPFLVLVVLFGKGGIAGLIARWERRK
jgi:branched-chain amino acid transport system permease protein